MAQYNKVEETNNIIYGEFLGHGVTLSLNYERFLTRNFSLRTGFGSLIVITSIPLMANYYIGEVRKLELGAGLVYIDLLRENHFFGSPGQILFAATIGHAFHPMKGGVIIRISFTPMYNPETKRVLPLGGLSVGYKF